MPLDSIIVRGAREHNLTIIESSGIPHTSS